MRKLKAILIGILLAAWAIGFLAVQQYLIMLIILAAALFFCVKGYREIARDRRIIAQARQERLRATLNPQITPPMTRRDTSALFVPEPLD
jgi:hypothetical protein